GDFVLNAPRQAEIEHPAPGPQGGFTGEQRRTPEALASGNDQYRAGSVLVSVGCARRELRRGDFAIEIERQGRMLLDNVSRKTDVDHLELAHVRPAGVKEEPRLRGTDGNGEVGAHRVPLDSTRGAVHTRRNVDAGSRYSARRARLIDHCDHLR